MSFEELTPRIFSFNAPYGACERCGGLGADFIVDPDLVVPDKTKSINDNAIYAWDRPATTYYKDMLNSVCSAYNIDMDTPFGKLSKEEFIKEFELYHIEKLFYFRIIQHVMSVDFFI